MKEFQAATKKRFPIIFFFDKSSKTFSNFSKSQSTKDRTTSSHNVLLLHKILNNKTPLYVCETFALMLHYHNTRSNNQIIIPQTNTYIFGNYSIRYQCISIIWNHFSNIVPDQNLNSLSLSNIKNLSRHTS